jgi:hypothetical protein
MLKYWRLISLAFLIPCFIGCNQDLSPLNSTAISYAPTPTPVVSTSDVFDNFEFGLDFSPAWCCPPPTCYGWPCRAAIEWSTDYAVSGSHSWKLKGIKNNNATDTWSGWCSLDSIMMTPFKSNFTGATRVQLYIRASAPCQVGFHWIEGGTYSPTEDWATEITVNNTTAWQNYSIPLSAFTTDCPALGNGIPDVNDVSNLWIYFVNSVPGSPCPSAKSMTFAGPVNIYIDDVRFSP